MNMVTASVLESARVRAVEGEFDAEVERRMDEIEELFEFSEGVGILKRSEFMNNWHRSKSLCDLVQIILKILDQFNDLVYLVLS